MVAPETTDHARCSDVKCSDCGCQTQVPFKPTEGRPVYCRDCYAKHKPKDRY